MLSVGIIGLGNAGNQVAMLAKKTKNIPSIAINTSERDIDVIQGYIEAILFATKEGVGKDRKLAKKFVKENIKQLIAEDQLVKFMDQVDFIFVVSSCGGGSGSGMGPIITDVLNQYYNHNVEDGTKGKTFINVGILPNIGESVGAQRNTLEYLTEMTALGGSYMLFDNGIVNGSSKEVFNTVNNDIVRAISIIRGDYSRETPYQMIDDKDFYKIITQPGMIFIDYLDGIYEEKIPVDGSIEDMLVDHINKNNHMVRIDRDKIVKRLAFISNLSEEVHPYFNENLPKIREIYGEPIEDYRHFSVNKDDDENNFLIVILSGLSLPENRLKIIKHRVDSVEQALSKQKEKSILGNVLESVDKYNVTNEKTKQKTEFNLGSIMDKYN